MYKVYRVNVGDDFYIGCTSNYAQRRIVHRSLLKHNNHFNSKLQSAYNSLDVKECVFTTEPPTTTPAPNFGFVQQENTVTPVNQYTYNKIYSVRKHK